MDIIFEKKKKIDQTNYNPISTLPSVDETNSISRTICRFFYQLQTFLLYRERLMSFY